mgnify:CR=1
MHVLIDKSIKDIGQRIKLLEEKPKVQGIFALLIVTISHNLVKNER